MVQLRDSGIEHIGYFPWGMHCCNIYETKEQLFSTVTSFFKAGLVNNELCIWISSGNADTAYSNDVFRRHIPGYDDYVAQGQMEVWSYDGWYLCNGSFDKNLVLNKWASKLLKAKACQYDGLRVSADADWISQEYWGDCLQYEHEAEKIIKEHPMSAMCNFNLMNMSAQQLMDMIMTHQFSILSKDTHSRILSESSNSKIVRKMEEKILALEKMIRDYEERCSGKIIQKDKPPA